MKCPFCKAEIPDTAKFCTRCGKNIPRNTAVPAEQPESASGSEASEQISGNFVNESRQAGYNQAFSDNGFNMNTDPALTDAIKGVGNMNIMQIACLIMMFIPVVNLIGAILLIVILIMSLGLTRKVSAVFSQYGYPLYAKMTDGIRSKCIFILVTHIVFFVLAFVKSGMGIPPGIIIVVGIFALIFALVALIYQIYCFCRLYTVKSSLESIYAGLQLTQKPGSGGAVAAIIVALFFIIIVGGGILAAIALPAYATYMKRARFTEVTSAAYGIQQKVELCFREHGENNVEGICDNTGAYSQGQELMAPRDYSTKYLESAEVSSTNAENSRTGHAEARITLTAKVPVSTNVSYIGTWNNGRMDWRMDPNSSCKKDNLC